MSNVFNGDEASLADLLAMTARTDPVLAELWDNEKDAAYDQYCDWPQENTCKRI